MANTPLTKSDFHKLLLVVCRGSHDREEYDYCIDTMFDPMDQEQRDYYWDSYCEMKIVLDVLNQVGAGLHLSTGHLPNEIPDNVVSIKPEDR